MTDAADYDDATFSECHYIICESYAQANPLRCLGLEAGRSRLSLSVSESLCPFRCLRLNRSLSFMWGGGVVKESPDGE